MIMYIKLGRPSLDSTCLRRFRNDLHDMMYGCLGKYSRRSPDPAEGPGAKTDIFSAPNMSWFLGSISGSTVDLESIDFGSGYGPTMEEGGLLGPNTVYLKGESKSTVCSSRH